jgi:hypothetical protein
MGSPEIYPLDSDGLKVLGAGSHVVFGMSSSLPLEPEWAPRGWRCPHRRLTLVGEALW